jgi:glycosyltransferase involved in cell wall biosynthesis
VDNTGISIVTGTLNRRKLLPGLIANTVDADDRLELILVDGGSNDGTQDYLTGLAHPRIRLIEVGQRSPYSHFMNLGVRAACHELVCQWNDDVFMTNSWQDVFDQIDESDVYIFAWKKDKYPRFKDKGWILINSMDSQGQGEVVVNYGIYHKRVFRAIGLYSMEYHFYCADGDMAHRAWFFGYTIKSCPGIKIVTLPKVVKYHSATGPMQEDIETYARCIGQYRRKELPVDLPNL